MRVKRSYTKPLRQSFLNKYWLTFGICIVSKCILYRYVDLVLLRHIICFFCNLSTHDKTLIYKDVKVHVEFDFLHHM